eukprot:scaffold242465_cov33-Tisochrysis_lutea.AAC.3
MTASVGLDGTTGGGVTPFCCSKSRCARKCARRDAISADVGLFARKLPLPTSTSRWTGGGFGVLCLSGVCIGEAAICAGVRMAGSEPGVLGAFLAPLGVLRILSIVRATRSSLKRFMGDGVAIGTGELAAAHVHHCGVASAASSKLLVPNPLTDASS